MKKVIIILTVLLLVSEVFSQTPEKISYQAIIRNSNNSFVTNKQVGMQISILQGTASGTVVYTETQTPTTNINGLVTLEIGGGTVVTGIFSVIDWANGDYFIKTETDPSGGSNYTITGTSQLLSVPYALFAKTAENITGKITETQSLADVAAIDNSVNTQLKHVTDPTGAQDAATKAYVDAIKESIFNGMLDAGLNGIVKDIDGNTYKTIKIGNQVWMAQNLKTSKLNNGASIPLVTDNSLWSTLNSSMGSCWYNNDQASYSAYGLLYNWYTVNTGNLCPVGWHVPTEAEWTTLANYYGGETAAGGKLKETGTLHWADPNFGATNESGFTALPGGLRDEYGSFLSFGYNGFWWTISQYGDERGWGYSMGYFFVDAGSAGYIKLQGFSVRCLRDY